MAALYNPKTLAKTIAYLLVHAPGEHGLFWDDDGSMPWKEFYWSMQEDPSLRFVRESHLREIGYLGIEFPAVLDGSVLRLKPSMPVPDYPVADPPPARLFTACRRKAVLNAREHGLAAAGRSLLAVSSDKELALRIARRRDSESVLIDVLAADATSEGIRFRSAGADLYLVDRLPAQFLRFPLVSEERLHDLSAHRKKEKAPAKPGVSKSAGSFMVEMEHMHEAFGGQPDAAAKLKGKGRKGAEWKRASRKERSKRSV